MCFAGDAGCRLSATSRTVSATPAKLTTSAQIIMGYLIGMHFLFDLDCLKFLPLMLLLTILSIIEPAWAMPFVADLGNFGSYLFHFGPVHFKICFATLVFVKKLISYA